MSILAATAAVATAAAAGACALRCRSGCHSNDRHARGYRIGNVDDTAATLSTGSGGGCLAGGTASDASTARHSSLTCQPILKRGAAPHGLLSQQSDLTDTSTEVQVYTGPSLTPVSICENNCVTGVPPPTTRPMRCVSTAACFRTAAARTAAATCRTTRPTCTATIQTARRRPATSWSHSGGNHGGHCPQDPVVCSLARLRTVASRWAVCRTSTLGWPSLTSNCGHQ